MSKKEEIDEIDRHILSILQQRGEIANNELADTVGLTPAPCLRRVQRLRQMGVIRRYTIDVDPDYLGYHVSAFVEISLRRHSSPIAARFMKAIQSTPQVLSCHMVAGDCDFILRVQTRDLTEYRKLIWEDLHSIDGVEKIHSIMVLDTVKDKVTQIE